MELKERVQQAFAKLANPSSNDLKKAIKSLKITLEELQPYLNDPETFPYGRNIIYKNDTVEVVVNNWANRFACAPHDHGKSFGWIYFVYGDALHEIYTLDQKEVLTHTATRIEKEGTAFLETSQLIHSIENPSEQDMLVTFHVYSPPIKDMKVYNLEKCLGCIVSEKCGAWWPDEQREVFKFMKQSRKIKN
ncbi:cysteine dioxygenase [Thermoflavimicrobium daqui]|jgi:cysteine dioxygenase|uniref:Cysteine dioxygenase n=1 Tax=Thermoflavimicrobium daqui TaxID=2137476 RepID=A0A364K9F8_9BACL|nr:cysteine dioxygenase family protein [Thermoflavimicrobium daqui]RAL26936.1 hypothetical protein DL897_02510 [Thermoflavimicrobium daqui]